MIQLFLFILPVLASSHIIVNIQTTNSSFTSTVEIQGSDSHIISGHEQITFGITDEVLRNAAEKYSGGRPKDVFLHSPTPWNDLYKTYGWKEVTRVLKPIKAQILDVRSDKLVITLKDFDNNSTYNVQFDGSLMEQVDNTVENKWSKAGILDVSEPIIYNINGGAIFSYSSPWGTNAGQTKKLTLGTNADVAVELKPGESVSAVLAATKVTITAQIDYSAVLSGHVACNYPKKYNGHHFWRYDINALLGAGGLMRAVHSSEVISIQFYTDANIAVVDKRSNAKITEVAAEVNSN